MRIIQQIKNSFLIKSLLLILIPWIILAVVFGLYDLQISNAVVNFESKLGEFGAIFGEIPGYSLIAISLVVIIGGLIKNLKYQKIPAGVGIIVSLIIFIYGLFSSFDISLIAGTIFISLVVFTLFLFDKDWKSYRKITAIILLLEIINPLLFVQLFKWLWGRVRFRQLVNIGFEFYTPWYIPNGPSSVYASFPSGHTAMGWVFLPLLILLFKREKRDFLTYFGTLLIISWGVFVALSRVIIGAHFASDVLFSTGAAFTTTVILYYLFYLRKPRVKQLNVIEQNTT
ncbi:MAG: phosphatase PAP2 family protein [Asgard group archaeon]|nr:phosphatase PAP2 family protein [Asgard group archaeon]